MLAPSSPPFEARIHSSGRNHVTFRPTFSDHKYSSLALDLSLSLSSTFSIHSIHSRHSYSIRSSVTRSTIHPLESVRVHYLTAQDIPFQSLLTKPIIVTMQLFKSLPLLLSFSAIAAAWPFSKPALTLKRDEIIQRDNVSAPYYLKTKVVPSWINQGFDGLYVYSYHTGMLRSTPTAPRAGKSDANSYLLQVLVLAMLPSATRTLPA